MAWYWVFLIPSALLAVMFVVDWVLVKDQPSEAGFPDFDTGDATSKDADKDKPVDFGYLVQRVFTNPVILTIIAAEFCTGFVRQGVLLWFVPFLKEVHHIDHGADAVHRWPRPASPSAASSAGCCAGTCRTASSGRAGRRWRSSSTSGRSSRCCGSGQTTSPVDGGAADPVHVHVDLRRARHAVGHLRHGLRRHEGRGDGRPASATACSTSRPGLTGFLLGGALDRYGWGMWTWMIIPFSVIGALLMTRLWNETPLRRRALTGRLGGSGAADRRTSPAFRGGPDARDDRPPRRSGTASPRPARGRAWRSTASTRRIRIRSAATTASVAEGFAQAGRRRAVHRLVRPAAVGSAHARRPRGGRLRSVDRVRRRRQPPHRASRIALHATSEHVGRADRRDRRGARPRRRRAPGTSAASAARSSSRSAARRACPGPMPACRKARPGQSPRLAARLHRPDRPVGLDIAGFPERPFPPRLFADALGPAREAGVPLTVHAGRAGPAARLRRRAARVDRRGGRVPGRAAHRARHVAGRVGGGAGVPARTGDRRRVLPGLERQDGIRAARASIRCGCFLDEGLCVSISTDDPLMFGPFTVAETLEVVAPRLGLTDEDRRALARNAVAAAFVTEERRGHLRKLLGA